MNQDQHIEDAVEKTLNSLEGLESAKADPWFSSRVMARWEHEQGEEKLAFWLQPRFQLAALALLLLLNIGGLILENQSQRSDMLDTVAQQYQINNSSQYDIY